MKEQEAGNPLINQTNIKESQQKIPHAQIVRSLRRYIDDQQDLYRDILRTPKDRERLTPAEILRSKLDWESGRIKPEQAEFFDPLRYAWDAIAYDHYDTGTAAAGLAGSTLSMYYNATHNPLITLTDQAQIRLLDAMAEAARIPHEKGRAEIEIPEKLRHYNKWLMSPEYHQRFAAANAKRNR